jgi:hypothetical protein
MVLIGDAFCHAKYIRVTKISRGLLIMRMIDQGYHEKSSIAKSFLPHGSVGEVRKNLPFLKKLS